MADIQRTTVKPSTIAAPLGAYSHAVRARPGEVMFIAGQVAVDANGDLVGPGDAAAQTRQALANIGAILESVGASFANVVELTSYVVGREAIQGFIDGRTEFFPKAFPTGEYATNTLLVVSGLVREEFLVEIKAIAVLP